MIQLIKTYEFVYSNGKWLGITPVLEVWQGDDRQSHYSICPWAWERVA